MISAALLMTLIAAGEPPSVAYIARTKSATWEPIALKEVRRIAESGVLASLSPTGTMQLKAVKGFADLKSADYSLLIETRFIGEAEKFSVYLTFGPGRRDDLPSFHVSDSVAIGKLRKPKMIKSIEKVCRAAGKRLAEVAGPQLASVRLRISRPKLDNPELPFRWAPVEVPQVGSPKHAMRTLLNVEKPDHERFKALAEIKGQVFDQQAARNVVELCVIKDPTPKLRAACVKALEPVARNHVPTQQVLLHALRNEVHDAPFKALLEVSKMFVGLSRKETIDTWLELVASDATPASGAGRVADALKKEGDVPNLDLAVAKCLQQEALAYGKKSACASSLLRNIPEARRPGVVWTYLERAGWIYDGSRLTFETVLNHTIGRGSKPMADAEIAELLLRITERRAAPAWMRSKVLYAMERHPNPSPALMQRLFQMVTEPTMTDTTLRVIGRLARRSPDLVPMTLAALERLARTTTFMAKPNRSDPNEELAKTIKRLKKLHGKK